MPVIIPFLIEFGQLLAALGIFLDGLGHTIDALSKAGFFTWLGSIEWSAVLHWSRSAPLSAPHLSSENEALYSQFQHFMDMQSQIVEMKRHLLTLPASPEEGF